MTKLFYSENIENKIEELDLSEAYEKADAYSVDGHSRCETFKDGFNLALKAKDKNLNVYYCWTENGILFFMAEKESDIIDKLVIDYDN